MKIYDCFTFYNEIELLKLRLTMLNSHVDRFVIVEANFSFNGQPKGFNFDINRDFFRKWCDKIIYVKVEDDLSNVSNPWIREIFQRNAIERGLREALPEDLILISDVDEIRCLSK